MKHQLLIILLLSLFLPLTSRAAILYLEPSSATYHQGDTFVLSLRIDAEEECLNTVEGNLTFPQDVLRAVDFSQGNSLLTLWVSPPLINQAAGAISFTGGIPGGYCGRVIGDPGESNLLGKVIFKAKEVEPPEGVRTPKVEFSATSQVLLNDGLGTIAGLSAKGAEFTILPKSFDTAQGKNEWQEELMKDKTPPEVFKIEINQDPSIFDGKYFIVFSTTDKQTGLDYYEVKEGESSWQRAASPYLLEDQGLRSIIRVRAVDKANNHLIIEQLPTKKPFPYWIIFVLLGAVIVGWLFARLTKSKRKAYGR